MSAKFKCGDPDRSFMLSTGDTGPDLIDVETGNMIAFDWHEKRLQSVTWDAHDGVTNEPAVTILFNPECSVMSINIRPDLRHLITST